MGTIHWKRVYEEATAEDGCRILVDRLWPRGLSKERAAIAIWAKAVTPSTTLRKAYHNGEIGYEEFIVSYNRELDEQPDLPDFINTVHACLKTGNVTFVYAGKQVEKTQIPTLRRRISEGLKRKEVDANGND
ncbi:MULTISPECIES: DUF488 domain-containing protein [Megasphaera]|uniref:PF04343 family protein n=1 Tax=Megasphaera vaginalis (ex Srinivasan et al. 2021) TaxID=1111454 RepID=U7UGY3_9FIRM|nr:MULTISPECIES: DUF488 family protein [Megasphaera]ERT58667.1 PF04343 family protein [Megasphaera vaginalis (ex Srinivasan et al. 2021)]